MIAFSDRLPPQVDGVEPALVVHFDPSSLKKRTRQKLAQSEPD